MENKIKDVPREILELILLNENLNGFDVRNFGATCRYFDQIVKNSQHMWKIKMQSRVLRELYDILEKTTDGNWYLEYKHYDNLTVKIQEEVNCMSAKFYWREGDLDPADFTYIFELACQRKSSFVMSMFILKDICLKGRDGHENPYTLTTAHYAKLALCQLMHMMLLIRWVETKNKVRAIPEFAANFFLQWIDPSNYYPLQQQTEMINELASRALKYVPANHPVHSKSKADLERLGSDYLADNMWDAVWAMDIHNAVKQVIFQDEPMRVTTEADTATLNICEVLKTRKSSTIVIAVLYEALARRLGLRTELISFHNHLFLEWRVTYSAGQVPTIYYVNLLNGDLQRMSRCPFSPTPERRTNMYSTYSHETLWCYMNERLNKTFEMFPCWYAKNALMLVYLLDFDRTSCHVQHVRFLQRSPQSQCLDINYPLKIEDLGEFHRSLLIKMVNLVPPIGQNRIVECKARSSETRYAVGMVCYHQKYEYVCVVRGWDARCAAAPEWQARMAVHTLDRGAAQPFYRVLAFDYSERYVAQENLLEINRPGRLLHLEEYIAHEFSHWDGFSYVPNEQKLTEYPHDGAFRDLYYKRRSIPHNSSENNLCLSGFRLEPLALV